jgi:hypothetical protein
MNCPACHQPLPTLTIRGVKHRAVKKTRIPKRYIDISGNEVLYVLPVPLLIVKERKNDQTSQIPEMSLLQKAAREPAGTLK